MIVCTIEIRTKFVPAGDTYSLSNLPNLVNILGPMLGLEEGDIVENLTAIQDNAVDGMTAKIVKRK
jgi:hypothetical protein